jgi:transcriptional regulator with XRE-family HTH domain
VRKTKVPRGRKPQDPRTKRGRALAAWMRSQGLSQAALAERAGVHRQTIWRVLHGDPSAMSMGALQALLAARVPPGLLGLSA